MKHPGGNIVARASGKPSSMILSVMLMLSAHFFLPQEVLASPPPSPISFPGCEKIRQNDGQWIGSVCPESIWANGIPYSGFAVYYFGFLASEGDRVTLHFRVDGGQERRIAMVKDTGVYFDVYNRNLFQARFIPYVPARPGVDLEIYFSRQAESGVRFHDEFGQHFWLRLKM